MLGRLQWIVLFVISLILSWSCGNPNPYKRAFERQFNQTCLKYPFVQKYWASIHQPKNKTVVFVFHEAGLNNCGLGDRLSGVLNAILLALRFDRTLLIKVRLTLHHPSSPFFHSYISSSKALISPCFFFVLIEVLQWILETLSSVLRSKPTTSIL